MSILCRSLSLHIFFRFFLLVHSIAIKEQKTMEVTYLLVILLAVQVNHRIVTIACDMILSVKHFLVTENFLSNPSFSGLTCWTFLFQDFLIWSTISAPLVVVCSSSVWTDVMCHYYCMQYCWLWSVCNFLDAYQDWNDPGKELSQLRKFFWRLKSTVYPLSVCTH